MDRQLLRHKSVRRDTRRLTAAMGDDAFMGQIAAELAGFTKPVLLAWAADDKHFLLEHARRLAGVFPDARLELIHGNRTWVMRDQPERTAHLIGGFVRRTTTRAQEWHPATAAPARPAVGQDQASKQWKASTGSRSRTHIARRRLARLLEPARQIGGAR